MAVVAISQRLNLRFARPEVTDLIGARQTLGQFFLSSCDFNPNGALGLAAIIVLLTFSLQG